MASKQKEKRQSANCVGVASEQGTSAAAAEIVEEQENVGPIPVTKLEVPLFF